ncbi:MAG: nuclease SbcCD subunit D [Saprospiraceae bacterium]|nr:MAG: nuclease SbcCD subunit D [Saprospiraceae bacterium]
MKVLHTSDWHLGQKFLYNDREEEHQMALDWLTVTIREQEVQTLIVAGDIFDIGNPPNYARRMYYRFLTGLLGSCCRHIVITGGNHDSPAMLNAPRELLASLNIHVVAAATEDVADEVIELKNKQGELEAVVAAVPFLRDRDLRYSVAAESGYERAERIRENILAHYQALAELMQPYHSKKVPILATGHLYASGAETSSRQDNIYVGNIENIDAGQFPSLFDYIALGHIHRAQEVGGQAHIRYSGSLIPLSFSETKDEKSVFLLEFAGKKLKKTSTLPVPVFRRLKTIQGNLQEVKERLNAFAAKEREGLKSWLEVIVDTDEVIPQLDRELQEFTKEMNLELLKIRINRSYQALELANEPQADLDDLDVLDVFRKKCESFGSPPEAMAELQQSFLELKDWMEERESI